MPAVYPNGGPYDPYSPFDASRMLLDHVRDMRERGHLTNAEWSWWSAKIDRLREEASQPGFALLGDWITLRGKRSKMHLFETRTLHGAPLITLCGREAPRADDAKRSVCLQVRKVTGDQHLMSVTLDRCARCGMTRRDMVNEQGYGKDGYTYCVEASCLICMEQFAIRRFEEYKRRIQEAHYRDLLIRVQVPAAGPFSIIQGVHF